MDKYARHGGKGKASMTKTEELGMRGGGRGGGEERNLLLVGQFSHCGIIGDIYVVGGSV